MAEGGRIHGIAGLGEGIGDMQSNVEGSVGKFFGQELGASGHSR